MNGPVEVHSIMRPPSQLAFRLKPATLAPIATASRSAGSCPTPAGLEVPRRLRIRQLEQETPVGAPGTVGKRRHVEEERAQVRDCTCVRSQGEL